MKHTTCNKVKRILNSDLVHNQSFIDLIEKNLLRFSKIICSCKIKMLFIAYRSSCCLLTMYVLICRDMVSKNKVTDSHF